MVGVAGKPPCPPCLSRCLSPWEQGSVETHQVMIWMIAHLYQWCFQGQKNLHLINVFPSLFKGKKRQVIVAGGSLLRGAEGPLCWISPPLCKISCISWVSAENLTRKLSCLLQPLDYLAVSALCDNEAIKHSPKASKRDLIQNIKTDPSCSFSCDCERLMSIF